MSFSTILTSGERDDGRGSDQDHQERENRRGNRTMNVKVKPLVWEGDGHWSHGPDEGWMEEANTAFGWGYSIEFGRDGNFKVDSTFGWSQDGFETPDDAKAATQADYESRILSALEPAQKVTAPELLERLAAAQEPLDAEFTKALYDNRESLYATEDDAKVTAETDLISALGENYWDLRCFPIPTGQGDADVGWRVIEHHMAKPHERVVAEVYIDDPAAAIRAALEAAKGGEG